MNATQLNERMVSILSQTSLSQISVYIQIFIPLTVPFFWEGIQQLFQQFNYGGKPSKEKNKK